MQIRLDNPRTEGRVRGEGWWAGRRTSMMEKKDDGDNNE